MQKGPILFVDMDDVTFDFLGGTEQLTGTNFLDMTERERVDFWHYQFTPEFFEMLQPAHDLNECIDELYDLSKGNMRFLTALLLARKDLAWPSMLSKMESVRKHLNKDIPVTFGPYAIDKQEHCLGENYYLIDDNRHNIEQWRSRSGVAIYQPDVYSLAQSVATFRKLIENKY